MTLTVHVAHWLNRIFLDFLLKNAFSWLVSILVFSSFCKRRHEDEGQEEKKVVKHLMRFCRVMECVTAIKNVCFNAQRFTCNLLPSNDTLISALMEFWYWQWTTKLDELKQWLIRFRALNVRPIWELHSDDGKWGWPFWNERLAAIKCQQFAFASKLIWI